MTKGHTLIELLVGLAILGFMFATSMHGLGLFRERNNSLAETQRLFHVIQYARSEAINRNQPIVVCGTQDQQHCSNDWSKGYMVFVDELALADSPQQQHILFQEAGISRATISSQSRPFFSFTPDGRSLFRGTIHVRFDKEQFKIVILDSGRCRIHHS